MLTIKNLTKKYDETILDNISFDFNSNKIYGLVGINGAGKTTLLKNISNLDTKYSGKIFLNNTEISQKDYLDLPIAFITDTPNLINTLTVEENLYIICASKKLNYKSAKEKIETVISILKLEKYRNYFPNKLSKGTLQRANLALSFIREEEIYLLDEPFSGLDPIQVKQLQNLIIDYHVKHRSLFIISSHDLEIMNTICDEIVLLHDKRLKLLDEKDTTRENINKLLEKDYENIVI